MTTPSEFAARMGMDADRAAEFAADMLRLTKDAAPLVYAKLKEPKE